MKRALFPILVLLSAGVGHAASQHEIAYMATIDGTCSQLVIADVDQTANCPNALLNTAYVDNYSSFKVIQADGALISFFGYDHEAKGDVAHLSVERILITPVPKSKPGATLAELVAQAQKETRDLTATGDCEYSNPALPDARINCAAIAEGKSYSFKFHPTGFNVIR